MRVELDVNGRIHHIDDVTVWESLLSVLRDRLSLYGAKNACEQGECGSCSVLVDDEVVCACLVLAGQAEGRTIVTVEGLDHDPVAHRVRCAITEDGGVQCGFCTPGIVVTATGLLRAADELGEDEVRQGLAGNLCRCTGYAKIVDAVVRAGTET